MIRYEFTDVKDKELRALENQFEIDIDEEPLVETLDINEAVFHYHDTKIVCIFERDIAGDLDCIGASRIEFAVEFIKGLELIRPLIKKHSIDSNDVNSVRFNSDKVLEFQITLEASMVNELVEKLKSFFREWYKERRDRADSFYKEFNLI